jgi:hypothetical protein
MKHISIDFAEEYIFVNGVKFVKAPCISTETKRVETHHIGTEDYNIERSVETDKAIVDEILLWCKENQVTSGEVLCQDDECIVDAPYLISDIIDKYLRIEDGIVEDK